MWWTCRTRLPSSLFLTDWECQELLKPISGSTLELLPAGIGMMDDVGGRVDLPGSLEMSVTASFCDGLNLATENNGGITSTILMYKRIAVLSSTLLSRHSAMYSATHDAS